jgi:hypothetical protein
VAFVDRFEQKLWDLASGGEQLKLAQSRVFEEVIHFNWDFAQGQFGPHFLRKHEANPGWLQAMKLG